MCGIFAVFDSTDSRAAQLVFSGLKNLEYRGYDSWGVSSLTADQELEITKRVGAIGKAQVEFEPSLLAVGHTRWATHGGVTEQNAHPHQDCTGRFAVVHNGIIENMTELKAMLISKGHVFRSQTDSEVLPHLIEEFIYTQDFLAAVNHASSMIVGANAFVVLDRITSSITGYRRGSPLVVARGKGKMIIASDPVACSPWCDEYYPLSDDQIVYLDQTDVRLIGRSAPDQAAISNASSEIIKYQQYQKDQHSPSLGKFTHFLEKEICEQPAVLHKLARQETSIITQVAAVIRSAHRVWLTGCGSAYHAGLFGQLFFAQQAVSTQISYAHESTVLIHTINKSDVLICVSQSGETIDTILTAQAAQRRGAKIISLVNTHQSSLERLSDLTLHVLAGPEIAVVSTKAFIAQVVQLFLISQCLANTLPEAQKRILEYSTRLAGFLSNHKMDLKTLAHAIAGEQQIFLIGRGLNLPATLEAALKLKETTYIHAEGFPAAELKHGVLSLIKQGTVCIALLSDDHDYTDTLSSIQEVKARGGKMIGISPKNDPLFDAWVQSCIDPLNSALSNVVMTQYIAYYIAHAKGLDPDKPRNLAKSVTVK